MGGQRVPQGLNPFYHSGRREQVLAWIKRQAAEFEPQEMARALSIRTLNAQKICSRLAAEPSNMLVRVRLGVYRFGAKEGK